MRIIKSKEDTGIRIGLVRGLHTNIYIGSMHFILLHNNTLYVTLV
jgi:hypothetical protein